ncbi:hypothetical protein HHK36_021257 [Tetracentron sinense]|uniref:Uncharacterized protein n=1 Tax=Tetracentron sinense TaxID=13715 RepID=A0A835D7N0_TETSI|nr:hypothetical protein HHK36_021257 [Tetracentron sinense]
MSKKIKRGLMVSSSSYDVDVETRTRFKYQSLLEDYEVLQKETKAKKKKLQRTKEKKVTLLAEVRFLRRRYKYLLKIQSPNPPVERCLAQPQNSEIGNKILAKERSYSVKGAGLRSPRLALDLNQISVVLEPSRMEKPKKCLISGGSDKQPNDLKLSVCKGIESGGSGSNRPGKRKITWQDQVALKV